MSTRNKTIILSDDDIVNYKSSIRQLDSKANCKSVINSIFCQDTLHALQFFPSSFCDLIFVDPPYNLTKKYHTQTFRKMSDDDYELWCDYWISQLKRLLKPCGSIYVCCDWQSSLIIYNVLKKYFIIRNRITWEREKGRGARKNWKNNLEDIWFATMSNTYTFNIDSVKLARKVLTPYKNKDWWEIPQGKYRFTYPSNVWTDISIPFWSMPENTKHPTQKPEKLLAKIILASSNEKDVIFDPFIGSGTTAVVAKKLNRYYSGIDCELNYCCLAKKRLELANTDKTIQGYKNNIFWERNSQP